MFFIKNILVFFGGKSPEREISVITGLLTFNCLDKELYNPIPVYVDGQSAFYTGKDVGDIAFYRSPNYNKLNRIYFLPGSPVVCFYSKKKLQSYTVFCGINCMHGRGGEDGTLIGLLRLCNIPFVGSDLFASSLAIDKEFTKKVLNGIEINTVDYFCVKRKHFYEKSKVIIDYLSNRFAFPLIVKPARLGSSIGIKKVDKKEELFSALTQAFNYDDKVVCEKFLQGARDLNCAVYEGVGNTLTVSEVEEAMHSSGFLSFDDKYGSNDKAVGNNRKIANDLAISLIDTIKESSKKIYRKLEFSSIVRFDYLLHDGKIYLNEINSIPGSMAYYLFCSKFSEFKQILTELIEVAIDRKKREDNYIDFYSSNVLFGDFSGIKK